MLCCSAFSQEASLQQDYPSYPAHGKRTDLNKTCAECFDTFSTNSNLEQHASSAGHNAFSCTCGAQFSRAYTLTRHINSMIRPGFSCELCDDKAFPRLDKLADHLRRWHRLGDKAFDLYKGRNSPPGSASPPTAEALRQAYPVVPDVRSVSMFDDFPAASNNVHYCISGETSVSPDRSTVSSNFLYLHMTCAKLTLHGLGR